MLLFVSSFAGFVHPLFALISPIAALVLFLVNMNKLIPAVEKHQGVLDVYRVIGYFVFCNHYHSTNFFAGYNKF